MEKILDKTLFDITSDNFELFFERGLEEMTDTQKELLPKKMLNTLFNVKGVKIERARKMSFAAKAFVFFRALKKRIIILIEDEEKGITEQEYFEIRKSIGKNNFGHEPTSKLTNTATFVLGNKELCDTFHKINLLSGSRAYNYIMKGKNKSVSASARWSEEMNYVARFISNYEANRKRLVLQSGLSMADWMVLIHLYHGNPVQSAPIYKEHFRYSFNSSSYKIKNAFSTLRQRGYIEKIGVTINVQLRITALGKDKVNEVLRRYVLDV